jgi:hypothetical protein
VRSRSVRKRKKCEGMKEWTEGWLGARLGYFGFINFLTKSSAIRIFPKAD